MCCCYFTSCIMMGLFQVPNLQLKLPGKKLFGNNLDPQFVAQRREGLNAFVQQVMQDPKLLNMSVFCDVFLAIIITFTLRAVVCRVSCYHHTSCAPMLRQLKKFHKPK